MFASISEERHRIGRICYIAEAALEYFISLMVSGAYLARITTELGFSDSLTGVLSSFVSLGCVFQLGAIRLFRNSRRIKRPVICCHIINQIFFSLVYSTPIMPLSSTAKASIFLVCFCGAYILSNLIHSPKVAWQMSHVPEQTRGIFTARKEIVSLLGGMLFTFLVGSAIDALEAQGNLRASFLLGSILIFILMLLHTASLIPIPETPCKTNTRRGNIMDVLQDRMYLRILPVIIIWHIASSSATPFYGAYQIKELGFSMTFISVLSIAYSLIRAAVSPIIGRYADKTSFSRMICPCLGIAAAGFFVNCFTVPENGKLFYSMYYCLYAIAMAGINGAMSNLVYDCVQGEQRSTALAISTSLGGLSGFAATCVMSPVVSAIQSSGNRFLSLSLYPAQFVSAVACVITLLLIVYLKKIVIPAETTRNPLRS